jgi:hypothetical protein
MLLPGLSARRGKVADYQQASPVSPQKRQGDWRVRSGDAKFKLSQITRVASPWSMSGLCFTQPTGYPPVACGNE